MFTFDSASEFKFLNFVKPENKRNILEFYSLKKVNNNKIISLKLAHFINCRFEISPQKVPPLRFNVLIGLLLHV